MSSQRRLVLAASACLECQHRCAHNRQAKPHAIYAMLAACYFSPPPPGIEFFEVRGLPVVYKEDRMVARTFGAFDNEAFRVVSSPGNLASGSPIINNSNTPIGTVFEFTDGFPLQIITLDDADGPPNDQFFNDDDENDHIITNGAGLVATGTPVESESYHFVRQLGPNGNPIGPEIQITVFSQNGQTSNIWGMSTNTPLIDGVQYVKTRGSNNGTSDYQEFICFTSGTSIMTQSGPKQVDDLRQGDKVVTRDNGLQEVCWIGSRTVLRRDAHFQRLAPVQVAAGALGNGMPERDTVFSPNHGILWQQSSLDLLSGQSEVFAAAKTLVGHAGITRLRSEKVTYVHVMFERHEALLSNGMWSESFLPGPVAMSLLARKQRAEITTLFPELAKSEGQGAYTAARPVAKKAEISLSRA